MRRNLLIVAVLIALSFVAGWAQAGRTRWEYKAIGSPKDLDALGNDGWELTAIDSSGHVFYLKRAK